MGCGGLHRLEVVERIAWLMQWSRGGLPFGFFLEVNDLAVLEYVNRQTFSPSTLDLSVDSFGEAFGHIAKALLQQRRVDETPVCWLHVESRSIGLGLIGHLRPIQAGWAFRLTGTNRISTRLSRQAAIRWSMDSE